MVFWQNLKIALHALRANLMRSILTTLGIIIGITTVIAIVSIVDGLNDAFSAELKSIGQGTLYVQKFPWGSHDWRKYKNYPDVGWKEYKAIDRYATLISGASPIKHARKPMKWSNRRVKSVSISGVNKQYASIRNIFPAAGRNFSHLDIERARNVVLIGHDVAEELFGPRNPVGQKVRIGIDSFTVIGVMSERGDFFDQNLDEFALIPYTTFNKTIGHDRHFTIIVKVIDPSKIEQAKDELRGILRRVRKLSFVKEDNFAINQVDVLKDLYDKLTGGLYAAMFAVAGISLLIGGIGIMNIMLVSVTERTREIGVRKALGAKSHWILIQFLIESVILALLGGAFGVCFGAGIAKLVASVSPLPATVRLWSVITGFLFSSFVGIIFGIFPARAAAKKNPIEALRYE